MYIKYLYQFALSVRYTTYIYMCRYVSIHIYLGLFQDQ